MVSRETQIGKIINKYTDGKGTGYYYPDECRLDIYFIGASKEQATVLLRHVQNHVNTSGLWSSIEKISVIS